jgi:hypothetical protein
MNILLLKKKEEEGITVFHVEDLPR